LDPNAYLEVVALDGYVSEIPVGRVLNAEPAKPIAALAIEDPAHPWPVILLVQIAALHSSLTVPCRTPVGTEAADPPQILQQFALLNLGSPRGRADEPDRSSAAARAPLPLLRRPHDHHRDLRGRLPATSSANRASRNNQDRYLMSVDASHTTARFPRWSSTGNAAARPDASPALHLSSRGALKPSLSTAHSNPISRSSTHNYKILAP
jgi:hypothetical protein